MNYAVNRYSNESKKNFSPHSSNQDVENIAEINVAQVIF